MLAYETLDDRREVYGLLARLPPADRVAFLSWCCGRVPGGAKLAPAPAPWLAARAAAARRCDRADARLTAEVYVDFWALVNAYHLAPGPALAELARRVRKV